MKIEKKKENIRLNSIRNLGPGHLTTLACGVTFANKIKGSCQNRTDISLEYFSISEDLKKELYPILKQINSIPNDQSN